MHLIFARQFTLNAGECSKTGVEDSSTVPAVVGLVLLIARGSILFSPSDFQFCSANRNTPQTVSVVVIIAAAGRDAVGFSKRTGPFEEADLEATCTHGVESMPITSLI